MTDLIPLTALGCTAARHEKIGAFHLTERPNLALASLSLRKGQAVPSPFGLVLPGPGQAVWSGDHGAFWTGRDQWMIEANGQTDLAALLKAAVPNASITEQTDGFAAFELTTEQGADAIDEVMRKLVNLDPHAFEAGSATRTTLDHISVFLIRRAPDKLSVIGMRTYAAALWHALAQVARRTDADIDARLSP
ncbi:MAG: sarcosine oxidase subunit gamma [Rhodobacteraceae bacterium]|nr:sarcosine oxidase subunit gamma [Paracoccaceae bacterium]